VTETVTEPVEDETVEDDADLTPDDETDDEDLELDDVEPIDGPDEADEVLAAAQTEKEIEKRQKALEREAERHEKRVRELLGSDAEGLLKCEACPPAISGYHYGAEDYPPGTSERALYEMLAGGTDGIMAHPSWLEQCPECHGYGKLLTGSRVELTQFLPCPVCKNAGYLDTRSDSPLLPATDENGNASVRVPPPVTHPEPDADMWGRPLGHANFGKFPIYLTDAERASDLAEGFTVE
jgi:rubrerythrin